MHCRWLQTFFMVAAVVAVESASAQSASGMTVYKWVDEQGATHYSESPPKGKGEARKIEIQAAPPSSALVGPSLREQEVELQRRTKEREEQRLYDSLKQRAIEVEVRSRECERAKLELGTRESMRANRIPDPYVPGRRTATLDELRITARKWCD